jgi:hypothetical protein
LVLEPHQVGGYPRLSFSIFASALGRQPLAVAPILLFERFPRRGVEDGAQLRLVKHFGFGQLGFIEIANFGDR